jgi:hypothetical protein
MKFGAGYFDGDMPNKNANLHRAKYLSGTLLFATELNTGFSFHAASGFAGRHFSVPFGTYILTRQRLGWIIENLYHHEGVAGRPGFEYVWNVGVPGDETSTGYDPALGRQRHEIQIHCEPRFVSEGCIVLDVEDFPIFADAMIALENAGHKLGLIVSPNAPTFKVIKV